MLNTFKYNNVPKCVVMCSTSVHFDNLEYIIERLNTLGYNSCLFFDEYQELEKRLKEIGETYINDGRVSKIFHITATPPEQFLKCNPFVISSIKCPNYKGIGDCLFYYHAKIPRKLNETLKRIMGEKSKKSTTFFFDSIYYSAIEIECLKSGNRIFIPAYRNKISHEIVKNICFQINPERIVVVINGTAKAMFFKDREQITLWKGKINRRSNHKYIYKSSRFIYKTIGYYWSYLCVFKSNFDECKL